jgi:hypothetical protein
MRLHHQVVEGNEVGGGERKDSFLKNLCVSNYDRNYIFPIDLTIDFSQGRTEKNEKKKFEIKKPEF